MAARKPGLVILDRDGVINHDSPDYIKSAREWRPIPGSLEAIARLTHGDCRVAVATNQSGLARGLFDYAALFAMHDKMTRMVAELGGRIDGIFFCPHTPQDGCACRKPAPGLLRQIGQRLQMDLAGVPMIGDSAKDVQAARAAGARSVLVRTGNGQAALQELGENAVNLPVYDDLAAAVDAILAGTL